MAMWDGQEPPEPEENTDSITKQHAALAELSQLALQRGELAALMESAVGFVAETLHLRYCEVLEFQPSRNEFLLRAGLGWKPGSVGVATVPVSREFQAGYTFLTQRRVVAEDYSSDAPFVLSPLLAAHKILQRYHGSHPRAPESLLECWAHTVRAARSFTRTTSIFSAPSPISLQQPCSAATMRKLCDEVKFIFVVFWNRRPTVWRSSIARAASC